MKTLLFTMLFISTLTLSARLGETPVECQKRYGKAVKVMKEDKMLVFEKSGFMVVAVFWKNKVHQIGFAKKKRNVLGKPVEMSDVEIKALLKANSSGKEWKKSTVLSMDSQWILGDDLAIAQYKNLENMLYILSGKYAKHLAAEKAKKEKENINGF